MTTTSGPLLLRVLGGAFVFQFATSLAAGLLSAPMLGGTIDDVLREVSDHPAQLRASIALQLLTAGGIIVLASLMYRVLHEQNRPLALVALALWWAEAVLLAVSTLGLYALLSVATGPSRDAASLGTLALDLDRHAGDIDMLFFCCGALVWYSLLLRSRIVPRALALWGLVAVVPVLVGTLILVWDRSLQPSIALYAAYVPFELVVGLWLLVRGGADPPRVQPAEPLPGPLATRT